MQPPDTVVMLLPVARDSAHQRRGGGVQGCRPLLQRGETTGGFQGRWGHRRAPVSYAVREREILTRYSVATETSRELVPRLSATAVTDCQVDSSVVRTVGGLRGIAVTRAPGAWKCGSPPPPLHP